MNFNENFLTMHHTVCDGVAAMEREAHGKCVCVAFFFCFYFILLKVNADFFQTANIRQTQPELGIICAYIFCGNSAATYGNHHIEADEHALKRANGTRGV